MRRRTVRTVAVTLVLAGAIPAPAAESESESAGRSPEEIAELVLGASRSRELSEQGLDYLTAAWKLFEALPEQAESDRIWAALYHIRTMLDGAAPEEYAHMAFLLSKHYPRIFYDRFMSGDAYALILQEDVFLEDTLVLHGPESEDEATSAKVRAVLDKVVASVSNATTYYSYSESADFSYRNSVRFRQIDSPRLHEAFVSRLTSLRKQWEEEREQLLRLRNR